MSVFSENIKTLRKIKKITQKEMSEKLQISKSAYIQLERDEIKPRIENLIKISEILEVDIDSLIKKKIDIYYDIYKKIKLPDNNKYVTQIADNKKDKEILSQLYERLGDEAFETKVYNPTTNIYTFDYGKCFYYYYSSVLNGNNRAKEKMSDINLKIADYYIEIDEYEKTEILSPFIELMFNKNEENPYEYKRCEIEFRNV